MSAGQYWAFYSNLNKGVYIDDVPAVIQVLFERIFEAKEYQGQLRCDVAEMSTIKETHAVFKSKNTLGQAGLANMIATRIADAHTSYMTRYDALLVSKYIGSQIQKVINRIYHLFYELQITLERGDGTVYLAKELREHYREYLMDNVLKPFLKLSRVILISKLAVVSIEGEGRGNYELFLNRTFNQNLSHFVYYTYVSMKKQLSVLCSRLLGNEFVEFVEKTGSRISHLQGVKAEIYFGLCKEPADDPVREARSDASSIKRMISKIKKGSKAHEEALAEGRVATHFIEGANTKRSAGVVPEPALVLAHRPRQASAIGSGEPMYAADYARFLGVSGVENMMGGGMMPMDMGGPPGYAAAAAGMMSGVGPDGKDTRRMTRTILADGDQVAEDWDNQSAGRPRRRASLRVDVNLPRAPLDVALSSRETRKSAFTPRGASALVQASHAGVGPSYSQAYGQMYGHPAPTPQAAMMMGPRSPFVHGGMVDMEMDPMMGYPQDPSTMYVQFRAGANGGYRLRGGRGGGRGGGGGGGGGGGLRRPTANRRPSRSPVPRGGKRSPQDANSASGRATPRQKKAVKRSPKEQEKPPSNEHVIFTDVTKGDEKEVVKVQAMWRAKRARAKTEEEKSVVKVQSLWRGKKAREKAEEEKSVVKVQSLWRGKKAREQAQEEKSVVKVQAMWRGKQARKAGPQGADSKTTEKKKKLGSAASKGKPAKASAGKTKASGKTGSTDKGAKAASKASTKGTAKASGKAGAAKAKATGSAANGKREANGTASAKTPKSAAAKGAKSGSAKAGKAKPVRVPLTVQRSSAGGAALGVSSPIGSGRMSPLPADGAQSDKEANRQLGSVRVPADTFQNAMQVLQQYSTHAMSVGEGAEKTAPVRRAVNQGDRLSVRVRSGRHSVSFAAASTPTGSEGPASPTSNAPLRTPEEERKDLEDVLFSNVEREVTVGMVEEWLVWDQDEAEMRRRWAENPTSFTSLQDKRTRVGEVLNHVDELLSDSAGEDSIPEDLLVYFEGSVRDEEREEERFVSLEHVCSVHGVSKARDMLNSAFKAVQARTAKKAPPRLGELQKMTSSAVMSAEKEKIRAGNAAAMDLCLSDRSAESRLLRLQVALRLFDEALVPKKQRIELAEATLTDALLVSSEGDLADLLVTSLIRLLAWAIEYSDPPGSAASQTPLGTRWTFALRTTRLAQSLLPDYAAMPVRKALANVLEVAGARPLPSSAFGTRENAFTATVIGGVASPLPALGGIGTADELATRVQGGETVPNAVPHLSKCLLYAALAAKHALLSGTTNKAAATYGKLKSAAVALIRREGEAALDPADRNVLIKYLLASAYVESKGFALSQMRAFLRRRPGLERSGSLTGVERSSHDSANNDSDAGSAYNPATSREKDLAVVFSHEGEVCDVPFRPVDPAVSVADEDLTSAPSEADRRTFSALMNELVSPEVFVRLVRDRGVSALPHYNAMLLPALHGQRIKLSYARLEQMWSDYLISVVYRHALETDMSDVDVHEQIQHLRYLIASLTRTALTELQAGHTSSARSILRIRLPLLVFVINRELSMGFCLYKFQLDFLISAIHALTKHGHAVHLDVDATSGKSTVARLLRDFLATHHTLDLARSVSGVLYVSEAPDDQFGPTLESFLPQLVHITAEVGRSLDAYGVAPLSGAQLAPFFDVPSDKLRKMAESALEYGALDPSTFLTRLAELVSDAGYRLFSRGVRVTPGGLMAAASASTDALRMASLFVVLEDADGSQAVSLAKKMKLPMLAMHSTGAWSTLLVLSEHECLAQQVVHGDTSGAKAWEPVSQTLRPALTMMRSSLHGSVGTSEGDVDVKAAISATRSGLSALPPEASVEDKAARSAQRSARRVLETVVNAAETVAKGLAAATVEKASAESDGVPLALKALSKGKSAMLTLFTRAAFVNAFELSTWIGKMLRDLPEVADEIASSGVEVLAMTIDDGRLRVCVKRGGETPLPTALDESKIPNSAAVLCIHTSTDAGAGEFGDLSSDERVAQQVIVLPGAAPAGVLARSLGRSADVPTRVLCISGETCDPDALWERCISRQFSSEKAALDISVRKGIDRALSSSTTLARRVGRALRTDERYAKVEGRAYVRRLAGKGKSGSFERIMVRFVAMMMDSFMRAATKGRTSGSSKEDAKAKKKEAKAKKDAKGKKDAKKGKKGGSESPEEKDNGQIGSLEDVARSMSHLSLELAALREPSMEEFGRVWESVTGQKDELVRLWSQCVDAEFNGKFARTQKTYGKLFKHVMYELKNQTAVRFKFFDMYYYSCFV